MCVYPDYGAVTYSLSGYVVDAEDGIVGVPGIFYEGDASRIAAAMLGEFVAGVAEVIRDNQFTEETSESGTASNITGSASRAQFANGVVNAMSNMEAYLNERMNRVVPFVRLDATREISLVLLEGVELRDHDENPWTLLVDGEKADQIADQRKAAEKKANKDKG